MNETVVKIVLIVSFLLISISNCIAAENEYGRVSAWFNDEPATAEGIILKINDQFEVKVEVESYIDGNVYVKLYEPGVTTAFEIIDGASEIDEWNDNYDINPGWKKTYNWKIIPNGDWTNGNAPINILVSFSEEGTQNPIDFTIANPYILDEHYSGPAPTRTTSDPSSTDQPSSQGSPGFGVAGALLGIALVMMARRN
ncbi:MAG: sarcinarray family MAST domain-containing protein [Methanosarcinales archaeon]|nr:sarcinarray family MAST domain-containing protein [Methanosarcinales archaeon]MCD4799604.1 sarcinarray family MAST domain-containing protein [Methanosarcinales archaeon]MCD4809266.1 sarcinarray family MAST domain-containing protein [Methanosarcinales archaeon]